MKVPKFRDLHNLPVAGVGGGGWVGKGYCFFFSFTTGINIMGQIVS